MGHPRRDSFCSVLAAAYRQRALDCDIDLRELVLADLEFDPHVREAVILEQALEPDLMRAREWIDWADHITFIYPIWWGTMPALLKGFLDRILLPGFAFAERISGDSYEGLLKGKSAQLITTMDTPPWVVKYLLRSPGHRAFSIATLGFCGIAPIRILMLGPVKHASPDTRLKWTDQAAHEAELLKTGRLQGIEATRHRFAIWVQALRLQFYPMTWIAYTAGACQVIPLAALWREPAYWWGYAVLFFIEVITVLLNEIHDYESDRQNLHHGPFTGGSRVLVDGLLNFRQLRLGVMTAGILGFISLVLLQIYSPAATGANVLLVFVALLLGIGYTVPPAKLCHRGFGEVTVAFTHSMMVVQCGLLFMGGGLLASAVWVIGLPLFFAVFPSIILSGIPDRRSDEASGKLTLAVRFGNRTTHLIAIFSTLVAMLVIVALHYSPFPGRWPLITMTGMLLHGMILIVWLCWSRGHDRSPRIDGLMAFALTFILWFAVSPLFGSQLNLR